MSVFLQVAKFLGLVPVLPKFELSGHHNNGKPRPFEEYIELPPEVVCEVPKGAPVRIWHSDQLTIWGDPLYTENKSEMKHINLKFKLVYKQLAHKILAHMSTPVCCVHVRRTDYLKHQPSLLETTHPVHIHEVLSKYKRPIGTVYIMTDEPDRTFFDPLKKEWNLKLFFDYPELEELKSDNYALFCVEKYIMDMADIRVSTFRTPGAWNKYDYFLDEFEGHH